MGDDRLVVHHPRNEKPPLFAGTDIAGDLSLMSKYSKAVWAVDVDIDGRRTARAPASRCPNHERQVDDVAADRREHPFSAEGLQDRRVARIDMVERGTTPAGCPPGRSPAPRPASSGSPAALKRSAGRKAGPLVVRRCPVDRGGSPAAGLLPDCRLARPEPPARDYMRPPASRRLVSTRTRDST